MAKLPYIRPRPVPIRPLPFPFPFPRPPYPVPFPLPVGYGWHPSKDGQESAFMLKGILYDGMSGKPEIDFNFVVE